MTVHTAGAPAPGSEAVPARSRAIYFVTADAEPGMLPRLVEPFAKMGLVPERVHASTEDGAGSTLAADLRVAGASAVEAHLIAKALARVAGVRQVISLLE